MAAQLFGCYRASEANDPEVFITAATAVLARYPEAIVRQVCDPVRGLPSQDKWLPSIAEIRMTCDAAMRPALEQERRDRVREETLAGRTGRKAPVGSPEHRRVVEGFAALRASMEDNPDPARAPNWRDMTPKAAEARLAELAGKYASTPLWVNTREMADCLAREKATNRSVEAGLSPENCRDGIAVESE